MNVTKERINVKTKQTLNWKLTMTSTTTSAKAVEMSLATDMLKIQSNPKCALKFCSIKFLIEIVTSQCFPVWNHHWKYYNIPKLKLAKSFCIDL